MTAKKKSNKRNLLKDNKKSIKRYSILFLSMVIVITCCALYVEYLFSGLPSLEKLETYEPNQTTRLYSVDGQLIHELFYREKRRVVSIDRIPEHMINSFIATEDHRFFQHWGVDSYRLFGSIFKNIKSLRYAEGFSTATMQLARLLHLNRRTNITRKLREIILAIQIEKRYSKLEILEMHLNKEHFGHGAYGVNEAAQIYYEKEVEDLTLEECALLTAQLNGPTRYSPLLHPDRALKRRNLVLRNMLNYNYITRNQYLEASGKPIEVKVRLNQQLEQINSRTAPYFVEHVRLELEKMQEQYNFDLYRDGLTVNTTLDTRAQTIADSVLQMRLTVQQNIVNERLKNKRERRKLLEKLRYDMREIPELLENEAFMDSLIREVGVVQGAFIAMDLSNGHVRAMIGGKDFRRYKFNIATQSKRQAGSIFKPFIYTVAIDNGYPVTYQLLNQPVVVLSEDGTRWSPQNYDHSTGGYTTLREGITQSLNLISARMIQQLVPATEVVKVAKKMGISTYIAPVDALALGTVDVIPLEMVTAFGAFPNKGILVEPTFITEIRDINGNIIFENARAKKREVLSEETAYIITDLLRSVVLFGSGKYSRITYGFKRPAGGKTGTTNDFSNAWFIGFTPQIVAGVWVGLDKPILTLGPRQSGQVVAVPIWAMFMKAYNDTLGLPVLDFERPEGVVELEICNETKKIAGKYCPDVVKEIFNVNAKPTETCDKHDFIRGKGIRKDNQKY